MKNIRIALLLGAVLVIGIFTNSCSSQKSTSYPKRLQRSVKCSGCSRSEATKTDNKSAMVAYHNLLNKKYNEI